MKAPVGWFERTPLGRILNRFSSDIQEVDKDVMDGLGSTLACFFSAVSIVIVISYTVRRSRCAVCSVSGERCRSSLPAFEISRLFRKCERSVVCHLYMTAAA